MEQKAVANFNSIAELAKQKRGLAFTGKIVKLEGVTIKTIGNLEVMVDGSNNQMPCVPDNGVELKKDCRVTVEGTYHDDFFKVYSIYEIEHN